MTRSGGTDRSCAAGRWATPILWALGEVKRLHNKQGKETDELVSSLQLGGEEPGLAQLAGPWGSKVA